MLKEKRCHHLAGLLPIFLLAGFVSGGILPAAGAALPQTPVPMRITAPVDDAVRVTLARSTHPLAQARFDRGPVEASAPMERMILVLGVDAERENQLRTFLDSQQTKGSPDYHHWLTPQEFGHHFGPSLQDVQKVTAWLQQQGFNVGSVAKSSRWIEFSGTAAQVNRAFSTQMRTFAVAGKLHTANNADIRIPSALAPVVQGVVSLHDFVKKPMHTKGALVTLRPDATLHDQQGNIVHALAPGDFANIYNLAGLPAGSDGTGQTIAIVARSDIDPNDFSAFKSRFSGANHLNQILNGPDPGLIPGDQDEATLDAEWSSAVAPGATIDLVISSITATTDGVDLSAAFIVDNNLASVMSTSFSQCEQGLGGAENAFFNSLWQQAAAQGISAFVSAGDDGAAGCDDPNGATATFGKPAVSGLASTPFNTAVGGTQFDETIGGGSDATFWNTANATGLVSVKGYIPEKVWNESCTTASCGAANANLFSGSGGQSILYGTPSWQSNTGIVGLNFPMRAIPDVSLSAAGHDGYIVCQKGSCQGGQFFIFAGTSASSPSFAGIMAIVDQKTGGRQGLANYVLYSLAKAENFGNCSSSSQITPILPNPSKCVFNDVITGNNSVPGQTGFNAGIGFDLASGLGSVNVANLVSAWPAVASFQGSATNLAVTSPSLTAGTLQVTHGTPVSVTATVTKSGGGAGPTGTVAIVTSQPGPQPGSEITLGAGQLASGSFSGTFSNLPGGSYNLSANYPGDGVFGSSTGPAPAIPVVVNAEGSTISLESIVNFTNAGTPIDGTTTTYGGLLILRSVVKSSTNTSPPDGFPSGPVTITDNGGSIGNLALNSQGQAELVNCTTPTTVTTPCLTVGSHTIAVSYGGDNGFGTSGPTSPITITVTKGTPTGATTAPATANFNQQITVSAQVNALGPVLPSGTVQFLQGNTPLGSPVTLIPGSGGSTASVSVTLTGTGNQNVSAQYSGDGTYNATTVAPSLVAIASPFNFTATANSQTVAAGGTATFNITLNDVGGFAGAVNLTCAGATGGATCTANPNPANLTATTTSVPVTVTVSNTATARLAPNPFKTLPWAFGAAFAGLLWGMKRKSRHALLVVLAAALIVGVGSCGGGGAKPPTVDTLTVTGTSGAATNTITLTLTVTH
jgi:hypothetical protein